MDGIIYDATDGCIKQYIRIDAVWLLSVLSFIYTVIIDRCINSIVYGRIKIDSINRYNKTYLRQKVCMIDTE